MKRLIDAELEKWRVKATRKPLLLRGARQVGKTYTIREFAKKFENFIEINLDSEPQLHVLFDEHYGNPESIIKQLSLLKKKKLIEGTTLIFIDEVQACKSALLSLRYFYEKLPGFHIIAAGSLIEFLLSEISFPVGRIEYLHLFPLNFKEFLIAHEELQLAKLDVGQITPLIHKKYLDYFKQYIFVGGMPEVVKEYITSQDLEECSHIQNSLIGNYRDDFAKYTSRLNLPHVRKIFDSCPKFLGQKFKYSNVSDEVQAKTLSAALELLNLAGVLYKSYHTSANGVPLSAEADLKKFKVFFLDIGLCLRILGLQTEQFPLFNLEDLINKGGLAEQFLAQEIVSQTHKNNHPELFYWHREQKSSSAEIDFIIQKGESVFPIEVKSGLNKGKKSLQIFLREKNNKKGYLFSLDAKILTENNITYLPIYSYFLLRESL